VAELRGLQAAVAAAGTFSRNEELDDVHTADLRYLSVPYLLSELLAKVVDDDRLEHLEEARSLLDRFVAQCRSLGVLPEAEWERLAEARPGDRDARVAHLKADRALAARIQPLEAARAKYAKGAKDDDEEEDPRAEEIERKYQTLLAEQSLRRAFDRQILYAREIDLLRLSQEDKAAACAERDRAQAEARRNPEAPLRLHPTRLPPTARERVLAEVFIDRNPATMSLDEFVEAHPEEFTPAAASTPAPPPEEGEAGSDDDEAQTKARAWDDWKDDHPRGWGNRKGNVG